MPTLPKFTADGLLPPGDHELTLTELAESMLVTGIGQETPTWDVEWRGKLVRNLNVLVRELWSVGVDEIFIDGSFAEDKDHPNDIDGYFVCERRMLASGRLQRELNSLNNYKIWTWDEQERRLDRETGKRQLPMWLRYRVELFPHVGQASGIRDDFGNELEFPAAFRRSRRDGKPRGIIKIIGGKK